MKTSLCKRLFNFLFLLVFTLLLGITVMAESYSATTMRLLRYEGTVEIEDESGKSGLVMENIRFNSGQSLHTRAASSASVGMDSSKIVTLDENTKVKFIKKSKEMQLSLTEGSFFLDVSEKLGGDESLDIKTSTMTVGIRGTIVVVSTYPLEEYQKRLSEKTADDQPAAEQAANGQAAEKASLSSLEETIMQASDTGGGLVSVIGVLEGNVKMDYRDENGNDVSLNVSGGQKATLLDSDENGLADVTPEINKVSAEDIFNAAIKEIQQNTELQNRLRDTGLNLPDNAEDLSSNPADGSWTYTGHVTVIAQSASKMFDGQPLTRRSDILVQGLPAGFTYKAAAGGTRTDAGSGDNPVQSFEIYNQKGENVTGHFTDVEKVSGKLIIDPAPLTAWSGSASKVYDGRPLTSTETKLTFSPGYEKTIYGSKNLSYVVTGKGSVTNSGTASSAGQTAQTEGFADSQTLYGICGTVLVHGSNPLTEEIKEIYLNAGQKLSVHLSDKDQEASIEYVIETITEDQVPEDILRIYADNPEILTQACFETGWDVEKLNKRIQDLPPLVNSTNSDVNGVKMDSRTTENLMEDCTNVRITIDTEGTNYNNRALNREEAHYTPMKADPSIKIITDASITDVGMISNTFNIDWGTANKDNYILHEQPGTLTVTPASAVVKTGSAEKVYDGTPLTNSEASISGLVHGETATVTATGSITNIGSVSNSYSVHWGSAKEKNYNVSSRTGTLRVTGNDTQISIKVSVTGKTYDGNPLNIDTVVTSGGSAETASKKKTVTVSDVSGSSKDSGIDPKGAQDETTNTVKAEGLPSGFTFKAHITGSRTDAGTGELTIESYQLLDESGSDVTDQFPNVEIVESTMTIDPAPATVTTGSASKMFDGTPLTSSEASVSGIVDADKDAVKVTAKGSITEIGTTDNTYTIDWGTAKSSNYSLTETLGTLEVTQNDTEVTFTAPSDSKTYDGTPLQAGEVTVTGLPDGFSYSAAASGSQTDAGSSQTDVDSYKILDGDGNDVTSGFSNIKTVKGTLTIKALDVILELNSYNTEFNGQKVLPDGFNATYGDGSEVEQESINFVEDEFHLPVHLISVYNLTGGGKIQIDLDGYSDAGTYEYEPVKTFLAGTESNYNVSFTNTEFTIEPLTVNLTVIDGSGVYDENYHGAELTGASCGEETASVTNISDTEWSVSGYTLFPSEMINVKIEGGGTNAGEYPLTYSYSFSNDDPDNYDIVTPSLDKIVVEALAISIDLQSPELDYNGRNHGSVPKLKYENGPDKGESPTESAMMSNDTGDCKGEYILFDDVMMTVQAGGNGPDAGTHTLSCTYKFTDGADPNNFKVDITGNTITINKITAVVTTGSATGPSGTMYPVTSDEASITGLADTDIEFVTITATGEQWGTGSSPNTYSIEWGTDDHPVNKDNYIIEEHLGTLTMYNAAITPPAGSAVPSRNNKAENPGETDSDTEKDAAPGNNGKDAAPGNGEKDAAGSNDESSATGQAGDESDKTDQAADQPDKSAGEKETDDSRPDQTDEALKPGDSNDSNADKQDQASENKENKDSDSQKSDSRDASMDAKQSMEASQSMDAKQDQIPAGKDSKPEQPDKASNNSENTKKDESSEESAEKAVETKAVKVESAEVQPDADMKDQTDSEE